MVTARNAWFLSFSAALLITAAGAQNTKRAGAAYSSTTGNIAPSAMWIDASQFTNSGALDICQSIAAAIASLPVPGSTPAGAVIDARNFPLPSGQAYLTCSVNPFTISGNANPLVLVAGGISGTTPGSAGGVVLLPGAVIATSVPLVHIDRSGIWMLRTTIIAICGAACGAIYPAYKAAQKDPIDALAYE
jgi:hypothetical protein